jgi:RNA polymerase sigma factor (sigma-70 family)
MTGETIHKELVIKFDNFYTKKYNQLLSEARSITQHNEYSDDIVNDTYLKVRNRIWLSGYTGNNFHSFCWRSIQNEWFVQCNRKKIRHFIDIDDRDKYNDDINKAEIILLNEEEWNQRQEEYYRSIENIVMILFKFIEINYSERDAYLFKTYFLLGETYSELSERTGYSKALISKVIKPQKKAIKINFERYLKNFK